MNPGPVLRAVLTACFLFAAPAGPQLPAHAAGEPDLSGEWVIDYEASDEPHDVLDSAMRGSRSGFGGFRAGVSIFGIPVEEVAAAAGDGSAPRQGEEAREDVHGHVADAIDALSIEQSLESMRIDYDGTGTSIYRNGETLSSRDSTVHADWRRQAYVVEREFPEKPKVTEEFRLARRNANRLHWIVTTELTSGKNVRIERVYDRASE